MRTTVSNPVYPRFRTPERQSLSGPRYAGIHSDTLRISPLRTEFYPLTTRLKPAIRFGDAVPG